MLEQFVTLWAVIDPIGTLPVFLAVTARFDASRQRRIAFAATGAAFGVLLLFILAGQFVLDALDISLIDFQIAGGIVLFLFALTMIFENKVDQDLSERAGSNEIAIFPLAMPSLASPGAMLTVVLLTDNNRHSVVEQAVTAGIALGVLLVALGIMLSASFLNRYLGRAGAAVISRVMGMVLAAVAVDNVLEAFVQIGVIPPY